MHSKPESDRTGSTVHSTFSNYAGTVGLQVYTAQYLTRSFILNLQHTHARTIHLNKRKIYSFTSLPNEVLYLA